MNKHVSLPFAQILTSKHDSMFTKELGQDQLSCPGTAYTQVFMPQRAAFWVCRLALEGGHVSVNLDVLSTKVEGKNIELGKSLVVPYTLSPFEFGGGFSVTH